jgi:hypothetical protein
MEAWTTDYEQVARTMARGFNLACDWIAGYLQGDPRIDSIPHWVEWRNSTVVKMELLNMALGTGSNDAANQESN